jgi:hypothetical protein
LNVAGQFALLCLTLQDWKTIAEIVSCIVGATAAGFAVKTYWDNSQRERAKWVVSLYEKFFEENRYKKIREMLDDTQNVGEIEALVKSESAEFTDYLNFFELVTFLIKTKQLSESDVLSLFHYYLRCLKGQEAVMKYVNNQKNGFEQLSGFFERTKL